MHFTVCLSSQVFLHLHHCGKEDGFLKVSILVLWQNTLSDLEMLHVHCAPCCWTGSSRLVAEICWADMAVHACCSFIDFLSQ